MNSLPPYRSLLFVPAHKPDWVPKAIRAQPDAIILDLEDAVPESAKAQARGGLADAVHAGGTVDETARRIGVLVRPNDWRTDHGPVDLETAVSAGVDGLLVPKVDSADQLVRLDAVLSFIERRQGLADGTTRVIASLETAAGLVAAQQIAAAPRVDGCMAAAAKDGDTARSVGFQWSAAGPETLAWRTAVVLACRAAGIHPIVGLWQELADIAGLTEFARSNRAIGFGGQILIHPSHVDAVNTAYAPSEDELRYYTGLLAAVEAAEETGAGAVVYEGDHVDAAHVATARAAVEHARRLR